MSDNYESSNNRKIRKLQNIKGYEIWRIYIMELMTKDGALGALTEDAPEDTATTTAKNRFKKIDEKDRANIALNLGEEPATLVTSLLMLGDTINTLWDKLNDTYQKENI